MARLNAQSVIQDTPLMVLGNRFAYSEARTKADAAAAAAPVAAPAAAHHSLNLSRRSMMMMTRKMIMTF